MTRRLVAFAAAVCLTLAATAAWAYWGAGSLTGGGGAAAASTVNPGAKPTVSKDRRTLTVSWAATTLATGQAVSGYQVKRYDAGTLAAQTILSACTGTVTSTSCTESNVPDGAWTYTVTPVIGTNWRGAESGRSATVMVDETAPTNSVTLSGVTGSAGKNGDTIYYRGVSAGSFTLSNTLSDATSGPASSATAALIGTATGWSHTPSTVSTPFGGPYVSNTFSWTAGTASAPSETVTGSDVAGNAAATTLTFVNDSTAPTAGTISYPDGFASGRSVSVSFTTGTDAGSGVATRRVQRAVAPLTSGTCGTFAGFVDVGADGPTAPFVDSSLAGGCYRYRYVVTDRAGNQDTATSANVARVGYAGAVSAITGLQSLWRLGESAASLISADSFAGAAGSALTGHTGEIGATWAFQSGTADTEQISSEGRAYRNGTGFARMNTAATPPSADYSVDADLFVKSNLAGDMAGVVGRLDTSTNTFYLARWEQADTSWNLMKFVNGAGSYVGSVVSQPALNVGASYRLRLTMTGSSLRLYVNGNLMVSATDTAITAAGKAGIMDGQPSGVANKTDTTGVHFDNFQVAPTTYPRTVDSKGTNTGDYFYGVTLGTAGALAGDTDTAASFDGVNDYAIVTRQISDDFSIEFWFKSTQGIGTGANWWEGAGLVDAEVNGPANDFGVSLRSDGKVVAGVGTPDVSIASSAGGYNNGSWHHVVFTRTKASGAMALYVDGVASGTATGSTASLTSATNINFGRLANASRYYAGSLDEIAVYGTVLTPSTISDHYQLGGAQAADTSGPTGGSVDATGLAGTGSRYATSAALSLNLAKGADPSGFAATGAELRRATAALSNGSCGTFGTYTLVAGGTDPTSPKTDTVTDQACYSYQYVVPDTMGNSTTYTSPGIKVDLTAPSAPTLAFSAFTNTYWSGTGTTVYYRSLQGGGSFTTTATSTDAASGIASYTFPSLGTGWTSAPGATGVRTYSWSAPNPAAPGPATVTSSNNAGTGSAAAFSLLADDTAPSAGTLSYVNGDTMGTSLSVGFTTGTDAGSGIGTRLLQRASAPRTDGLCGTFGAFSTVTNGTNPTSPLVDTVTPGTCYKYQYVVADSVGNSQTTSSASVAKVGAGARWSFDEVSGAALDSSGNGNTATLQAGASRTGGRIGLNALSLTGAANSFATGPTMVIDTSRSYSVAAWVRPASLTSAFQTIVSVDGASISPFYLQIQSGQYQVTMRNSDATTSTPYTVQAGAGSATVGTWTHLVAVHDNAANTISLYVNGSRVGAVLSFNSPWTATGVVAIGRARYNGVPVDFFSGAIDDVRLYDRVLTAAEVASLAAQ